MDVAPQGTANGRTVVLLHGNNFGGFYFKPIIDALTNEGFRVIVPDQIGYGRSSKPIAPYNFNSQARNTFLILQKENIERAMVVGHSMGGMLAARLATQYPKAIERLVIYNPIGLTDGRFDRPMTPIDESYQQTLKSDYQSTRAGLSRYVAHNPKAWNADFETYTRIRYSWTLSADWPRLAMVQALIGQMLYADPVVYDWPHIQVPTLAFGGAETCCSALRRGSRSGCSTSPGPSPTATAASCSCRVSATSRTSRRPRRCCRHSSPFSRRGWRRSSVRLCSIHVDAR